MSAAQQSLLNTRGMTSAREMRAFKRAKEIERLGIKRKPATPKPQPDFVNNEMAIPGESRIYGLYVIRCSVCDFKGGSFLEVRYTRGPLRPDYRVCCSNPSCKESTPWLPSSQAAIQLWKVTAALVK